MKQRRSLIKMMFFPYRKQHKRLKGISEMVTGKVLDVGFNQMPNPYLKNAVGLDIEVTNNPYNYDDFIIANLDDGLPLKDNSFDTITAGEIIEHLENPSSFLRECKRVLRPKGKLIITSISPFSIPSIIKNVFFIKRDVDMGHISMFTPLSLYVITNNNGFNLLNYKGNSQGLYLLFGFYRGISRITMFECENEKTQ